MSDKTVTFLVKERLTRHRLYTITADTIEEAEFLLDGFKQKPSEKPAANENIVVDDYEVIEVMEDE